MKKMTIEDWKVVRNIILLIVMTWPVCLLFTDSLFLVFLGAVYSVEYYRGILRPLYRRYKKVVKIEE